MYLCTDLCSMIQEVDEGLEVLSINCFYTQLDHRVDARKWYHCFTRKIDLHVFTYTYIHISLSKTREQHEFYLTNHKGSSQSFLANPLQGNTGMNKIDSYWVYRQIYYRTENRVATLVNKSSDGPRAYMYSPLVSFLLYMYMRHNLRSCKIAGDDFKFWQLY